MGTITWDTDINSPGCPGQIVAEDGRTVLVQSDWDYPGTAQAFGWSLLSLQICPDCGNHADEIEDEFAACDDCGKSWEICGHDGTDGTVKCDNCGLTASDFISAAYDWLIDNDGVTVDDPRYFE